MTSGVLYLVVGLINNDKGRYGVYDIFQIGTENIFKIVHWKFQTNKYNTIWISYGFIAPIVNFLSSIIWVGLFLLLLSFLKPSRANSMIGESNFWRRVFLTNMVLSLLTFALWLSMNLNFIYEDVYSSRSSEIDIAFRWLNLFAFLPSIVPYLIASFTLDQGGDTLHGNGDMYLITKTASAFALTIWAIVGVYFYDRFKKWRSAKSKRQITEMQNASS